MSHVHAERTVQCPFSIAAEYTSRHLRGFEAPAAKPIRLPLGSLGLPVPGILQRRVQLSFWVHYDVSDIGRRHQDETHFQWNAGTPLLPDLGATLRFGIVSHRETLLLLDGTYDPPFGIAGAIFDELLGRRLAAATADDLLARVGDALEAEERAFRAAHPPIV